MFARFLTVKLLFFPFLEEILWDYAHTLFLFKFWTSEHPSVDLACNNYFVVFWYWFSIYSCSTFEDKKKTKKKKKILHTICRQTYVKVWMLDWKNLINCWQRLMFSFNIVRNLKEGFSKRKQWLSNFTTDWNNLGTFKHYWFLASTTRHLT